MTALLLAKVKNLGQVFGILITILYSIVSFNNKFYGEVLIYLFMMFLMYIIGIVSWFRHKNKETDSVEVNKISKKRMDNCCNSFCSYICRNLLFIKSI